MVEVVEDLQVVEVVEDLQVVEVEVVEVEVV